MDDLLIRAIREDDLDAVVKLMEELGSYVHSETKTSVDRIWGIYLVMRDNAECYKNLVAVKDDFVVGFLSMVYYQSFLHA